MLAFFALRVNLSNQWFDNAFAIDPKYYLYSCFVLSSVFNLNKKWQDEDFIIIIIIIISI